MTLKKQFANFDAAYAAMHSPRVVEEIPEFSNWEVMVNALKVAEFQLEEYFDYEGRASTEEALIKVRETLKLAETNLARVNSVVQSVIDEAVKEKKS